MKNLDAIVKKAMEYKEKGLTDKEIGDELHLSVNTVTFLLTRGVKGEPPKDIKIGWRSIGVVGSRLAYLSAALSDIIIEEMDKKDDDFDTVLGISINGIPFATFISEELERELCVYRPTDTRESSGAFSSNYADVRDKKVVIVDDVLSSGDTIKGVISALQEHNATPVLIVVLVNKTANDEFSGVPLRALIRARAI
ncbi:MAG: orotate phosphoribosyltransferase-like protein [Thermoplasmata archaeon]|nr:orotate phosphoribosyltransferase-like protein [Thermoplasmata archaeon]